MLSIAQCLKSIRNKSVEEMFIGFDKLTNENNYWKKNETNDLLNRCELFKLFQVLDFWFIVENIIKDDFVIAYYRKETEEERKEEESRSIIVFEDFNENGIRFKFLLLNDMNRYIDDVKFNKNIITSTSPIFEDIDAFRYLMKNTDKIINKLHNLEEDDPLLKESFDRMGISKHFSFGLDVPDYSKEQLKSRFIKQEIYNQKPLEMTDWMNFISAGDLFLYEENKLKEEDLIEITETERRRKIFELKDKILKSRGMSYRVIWS